MIPLSQGHALAIGVLSYGDGLHLAFHADPTTLDEAGELPGLIETAISELEVAARARRRPARRQRREDATARRGTESVL